MATRASPFWSGMGVNQSLFDRTLFQLIVDLRDTMIEKCEARNPQPAVELHNKSRAVPSLAPSRLDLPISGHTREHAALTINR